MTVSETAPDEVTLVARARNGDDAAFEQLFERFYPMIYAFSYRACLDQAAAQDIAQEAFIKAARSLEGFRDGASFKPWIYRIATNTALDWRRARVRQDRLEEALQASAGGSHSDHSAVTEALEGLPAELRIAVALVFYEGMNHAEAASVLGCAETTVSWRIFRAKRKLKAALKRKGFK
jgi:RNA polymerase sigma-70 factor (ECF subfamily)